MISMPNTQHQAAVCGVCWLVELQFTSGTVRCTTAPTPITALGATWVGLGQLLDVRDLTESQDAGTEQLTISLSVVDTAMLALALGNVEAYRGKPARLWLQLMGETFQPVGTPVLRWSGVMSRVEVPRQSPDMDGGSATGSIELQCSRAGLARSRNAQGLRLTNVQQLRDYPGDTGMRHVRALLEQPALWLSKRFQEV